MDANQHNRYEWLQVALVVIFSLVSVGRIVSTYKVFNQTWDEPVHVASGMEWLQQGTYTYEHLHPPLARVAMAIGPYLHEIRLRDSDLHPQVLVAGGNAIFAAHGEYLHNLSLARLGVLPFFLLGIGVVFYWTRKLVGGWAAVAAVGLFTTLPPILGHAGLATTDLPFTATFVLALVAFTIWVEKPTTARSVMFGFAVGLALMSKFSALLFLPACGAAVVFCWLFSGELTSLKWWQEIPIRLKPLVLAALLCLAIIFACYRFSFHPVTGSVDRPHLSLDHLFGQQGKWHDLSYKLVENVPVPVPEFLHGIQQARGRVNDAGKMYLLGQVRTSGWWYFFPVALGVKTPIAFLILVLVGALGIIKFWKRDKHNWEVLVPLVAAAALLLVCLPTKLNIGLRHILPIYPLLSIVAGIGFVELWNRERVRWLGRTLAIGLAAWMLISVSMAHPDYLAYFNEFAGDHPERILVDSDLDWGQDALRLSSALHARGVDHVSIAYNGSADLNQMNLPAFEVLAPCVHTSGWIAISLYTLQMSKPSIGCGGYSWLEGYKPVTLVGKSIRLYWIPGPGETSVPANTFGMQKSTLPRTAQQPAI